MNTVQIPENAQGIIDTLQKAGYKAYVVGGCVRDSLLGRAPNDWDICTDATPEEIISLFGSERCIPTGLKHGTITVKAGSELFEVTTFRVDGEYSDGRRPDAVKFVSDLSLDLARRDFTVNAMAYNAQEGLIDPYNGFSDLQSGIIRCAGDPVERFEEDHLRLLRAIRFSAQLGFEIEKDTAETISFLGSRLHLAAPERIGVEFLKTVTAPHAAETFRSAPGKKMLCVVCPCFIGASQCKQNNPYHYTDVYNHILDALANTWTCDELPMEWVDDEVRMALILHDLGKPIVKTVDPKTGFDHFYNHGSESKKIAEAVLDTLRYSREFIDTVSLLVEHHDMTLGTSKTSARRMLNKFGEKNLKRLLKIQECDNRAHTAKAFPLFEKQALPLSRSMEEVLREKSAFKISHLAVNGKDIMESLKIPQGKLVGYLLNRLLDEVIREKVPNEKEELLRKAKAVCTSIQKKEQS